jgi:hypothetical protein
MSGDNDNVARVFALSLTTLKTIFMESVILKMVSLKLTLQKKHQRETFSPQDETNKIQTNCYEYFSCVYFRLINLMRDDESALERFEHKNENFSLN